MASLKRCNTEVVEEENSDYVVKRKFFQYSPEDLKNALDAVRKGATTSRASKLFNVPRSTIRNKINGKTPETSGRTGRESVLGAEIEETLAKWLLEASDRGFPINKDCLTYSVKQLMDADEVQTPFSNNLPGRKWFEGFLKRHPIVSLKRDEQLNKPKTIATEKQIRSWFTIIKENLKDKSEIWNDRRRVFSMDDTAVYKSPRGGYVLAKKDRAICKTGYNDEETSALFICNAAGEFAPPLTFNKYEELTKICLWNALKHWEIGRNDDIWKIYEAFYEYFSNSFYPYLIKNNIQLPVVVFLDGNNAHMSLYLSKFCNDHEIELCCLPPYSSNVLQPLDVSVFTPLKQNWKSYIDNLRSNHKNRDAQKLQASSVLLCNIGKEQLKTSIKVGFKYCGLYPLNVNAVDYTKCNVDKKQGSEKKYRNNSSKMTHRQYIEKSIDPLILTRFKQLKAQNLEWDIDDSHTALYNLWSKSLCDEVKQEILAASHSSSEPVTIEDLNFKGSVIFELPFFESP